MTTVGSGAEASMDMIDLLVEDHREVESLFQQLEAGGDPPERRQQLLSVVIAELVRHSVAEEQHLYPAARRVLDDGDDLADHEIAEHAEAEATMKQLESLEATDARFDELVGSLIADVRHHIDDEETDLFPQLRRVCPREDLLDLGRKLEAAKKVSPTRPHPKSPSEPPANKLLAPGAGLVDKVRDALTSRTTDPTDL